MKNLLIMLALISASFLATGAHHEEGDVSRKMKGNNFAYLPYLQAVIQLP
jgi:hypothetical protein